MQKFDIGVYGLGVMGSAIAKNMIANKFNLALYSKDTIERKNFSCEGQNYAVFDDEKSFIDSLLEPKKIFIMITSGSQVDEVIEKIMPYIRKDDIIIDGGNSFYRDTERRTASLAEKGIRYIGMGISGGEKGALYGPSIMAGGDFSAYESVKHIFTKIAAKHELGVCSEYIGPNGAGHYVKMVHNGIEYAMLQSIADAYEVMKNSMGLSHREIGNLFTEWKTSNISSYLIDITSLVFKKTDEDGKPLLEKVLDITRQKGTGVSTIIEGIERGVYIPTICESVFARFVSMKKNVRKFGESLLPKKKQICDLSANEVRDAIYASFIISFAQGLRLISQAGEKERWNINMSSIISVWKNGCIIRGTFLDEIIEAVFDEPYFKSLIFTKKFRVKNIDVPLRNVVISSVKNSLALPAFSSALLYYDGIRTGNMSMNLVSALRDVFGAHCYERVDREGIFHSDWEN